MGVRAVTRAKVLADAHDLKDEDDCVGQKRQAWGLSSRRGYLRLTEDASRARRADARNSSRFQLNNAPRYRLAAGGYKVFETGF